MKEICAIIRMNRINETKRALADAGFPSITVRKVVGRGKGLVNYLIQADKEGAPEEMDNVSEIGPKLLPKRMITVVVPDALKERAMEVIINRYSRLLWRVCAAVLSKSGGTQDVEECVADAFVYLWRYPERYDSSRSTLKTFLCMVARSRAKRPRG